MAIGRKLLITGILMLSLLCAFEIAEASRLPTIYAPITIHTEPGFYNTSGNYNTWQGWKIHTNRTYESGSPEIGNMYVFVYNETGPMADFYVFANGTNVNQGNYTNSSGWATIGGVYNDTSITFYVNRGPWGVSYLYLPNVAVKANASDIINISVRDQNWSIGSYYGIRLMAQEADNLSVYLTFETMAQVAMTGAPNLTEIYPHEIGLHYHGDERTGTDVRTQELGEDEVLVYTTLSEAIRRAKEYKAIVDSHFGILTTAFAAGIWGIGMNETDMHVVQALQSNGIRVDSSLLNSTIGARTTTNKSTISAGSMGITNGYPPFKPYYMEHNITDFAGTRGVMQTSGMFHNATIAYSDSLGWLNATVKKANYTGGDWLYPIWWRHTTEMVNENGTYRGSAVITPMYGAYPLERIIGECEYWDKNGLRFIYMTASAVMLNPYASNGSISVAVQRMNTTGNQWSYRVVVKNRQNGTNYFEMSPEWARNINITHTLDANETREFYISEPSDSALNPRRIEDSSEPFIALADNMTIVRADFDNTTNIFNLTVNGTGINKTLTIFYNYSALNIFDYDFSISTPVVQIRDNKIYSFNNGYNSTYNITMKTINITIPSLSTHSFRVTRPSGDSSSCVNDFDCSSSMCLHSKCRSSSPFCGDGYCDSRETCTSDCGSAGSETGGSPSKETNVITTITEEAEETAAPVTEKPAEEPVQEAKPFEIKLPKINLPEFELPQIPIKYLSLSAIAIILTSSLCLFAKQIHEETSTKRSIARIGYLIKSKPKRKNRYWKKAKMLIDKSEALYYEGDYKNAKHHINKAKKAYNKIYSKRLK